MEIGYFIWSFFITIVAIIVIFISINEYKNSVKKNIGTFNSIKRLESLKEDIDQAINKRIEILEEKTNELNQLYNNISKIKEEIKEKTTFNATLLKIREDELNAILYEKKKLKESELQLEIDEWTRSAQEAATQFKDLLLEKYQTDIDNKCQQLKIITQEITDYKEKRKAINQEILRARTLEEQQDFYRIQLDDTLKEDIQVLNDIRQRLNKTDLLNKLIYENYIARPTKEMVKRVLEGKNPSGIYKVTNIKTNEIYIGKSTKISDRFQNHVKSACGLEGVAESQFQRALKKYGVDNFTWELLEEVPKENLSEREKYYIIFYGTKDYGYNQREG